MKNVTRYNIYIAFIPCIWFFTLILIFFICQVSELIGYIFMAQTPVQILWKYADVVNIYFQTGNIDTERAWLKEVQTIMKRKKLVRIGVLEIKQNYIYLFLRNKI